MQSTRTRYAVVQLCKPVIAGVEAVVRGYGVKATLYTLLIRMAALGSDQNIDI